MKKAKKLDGFSGVARLHQTIPRTVAAYVTREADLQRVDKLMGDAISLVFKKEAQASDAALLRGQLDQIVERHLDRLMEEAQLGKYAELSASLYEIEGASSKLLALLLHAPGAALERLKVVPEGAIYPIGDWEDAGGSELPLVENVEVNDELGKGSRGVASPLLRRLEALAKLAKQAAISVEAESKVTIGAKSVWQAQTGRTPDQDLFEDCMKALGHTRQGRPRLRDVAKLISEAATGITPPDDWGRDHEARTRKWWKLVQPWANHPMARIPAEIQTLLAGGPSLIPARNKRGQKT